MELDKQRIIATEIVMINKPIDNVLGEDVANIIDGAAFAVAVGVVAGVISSLVGVVTIVWTLLRIYEMKTIQDMIAKWKARRNG